MKRISNANIFEAVVPRKDAQGRLINELPALLGGRAKLIMAHLVDSGDLTLDDIKEVERTLRRAATKDDSLCSQSTLCVGVAWLLTLALKENRTAIRCGLCLTTSVKFLIPSSVLADIVRVADNPRRFSAPDSFLSASTGRRALKLDGKRMVPWHATGVRSSARSRQSAASATHSFCHLLPGPEILVGRAGRGKVAGDWRGARMRPG